MIATFRLSSRFNGSGYGILASIAVGLVASVSGAMLLGRSWSACGIGQNSANAYALLIVDIPVLFLVCGAWWYTVGAVALRRSNGPGVRFAVAPAMGLVGVLVIVWLAFIWRHNPGGDYPATACGLDNLPPWWPAWIPA